MKKSSVLECSANIILVLLVALVTSMMATSVALAQPKPEFQRGFAMLADRIPEVVGEPLEEEHSTANGDTLQKTTRGLMVWSKADNHPRFTDGSQTWIWGPEGLQQRPNDQRLPWENPSEQLARKDSVFQFSTINALMDGLYDGVITVGELKKHGNFGLGTFDTLDGEMIVLGGDVYRVRADGVAYPVEDSVKIPFAAVSFFDPDRIVKTDNSIPWGQFASYLDRLLPTHNLPYAIKIEGEFSYLKARSVPSQTKPYPKLMEVVSKQPTFEFRNAKGTLVGFRLPSYMEGVNVPGYHFHFLTEDGKAGGHLLELQMEKGQIEIDFLSDFRMELPRTDDFYRLDLSKDKSKELEKVER